MAAPPAPLPPDVQAQQSPEQAQSAFAANGIGQPQPGMQGVQMILGQLQKLQQWLQDTVPIVKQVHPPAMATLAPIATAGEQLGKIIQEVAQRSGMAQGSPVMAGPPPGNPAAGPPNPAVT